MLVPLIAMMTLENVGVGGLFPATREFSFSEAQGGPPVSFSSGYLP